jgi:hypothetical protein
LTNASGGENLAAGRNKGEVSMAFRRVDGYQAALDPASNRHFINLYLGNSQVRVETVDASVFLAAVDLLRNEKPNIFWEDTARILYVGLEPIGEGEV